VQTTAWEFESRSNAVLSGTTCIQQPQPVYPEHIKLPAKLLDYFLRSNKNNINQMTDWADAKGTRNLLKLGGKGRPCHFCLGGPDCRVHWCHECPAWQPAFVQVALTASAHLATQAVTGGNSLLFRPDFRLGFAGPDCKMTSDKEA